MKSICKGNVAAILIGIIFTFVCACDSVAPTAPDNMDIFILAGQSNMSGRGSLADLPRGFNEADERIWLFGNNDMWRPAVEPLDDSAGQADNVSFDFYAGVGPGLAFAKRLKKLRPAMIIGLVPCAMGGTSMDQWMAQGGEGTLYGSCIRRAKLAAQKGRIAGMLWYQGEADAWSAQLVSQWPDKFKILVGRFRRDTHHSTLPVVFVQIGDLGRRLQDDPRTAMWSRMQKAQAGVNIDDATMVSAMGLPLRPDGIHLSTKAQLALGAAAAVAMENLFNPGED